MGPREDLLKLSYKLLPPPLSAIPAKYWTSISLWLHSYSVGRLFQTLTEAYNASAEANLPEGEEAFLIGFIHDLGQKLAKTGVEMSRKWVRTALTSMGYTEGEARVFEAYLLTNPAETTYDPFYPRKTWYLLRLADRIQGTFNPIEIVSIVRETGREIGRDLVVRFIHVAFPQTFLRAWIAQSVYSKIISVIEEEPGSIIIPVSTPLGALVITEPDSPLASNPIELSWDDDVRRRGLARFLPREIEEMLYWNVNCCKNKDCINKCKEKGNLEECKRNRFIKRDCNGALYTSGQGKPSKTSGYEIALIYYGSKESSGRIPILSGRVRDMLIGVSIDRVKFTGDDSNRYVCPICGMRTPVGVVGDFLRFFNKRIKTEQWNRRLYPGNVNSLMQNTGRYLVDPLCLGDVILRSRIPSTILASITVQAPIPVVALEEIKHLMWRLVRTVTENVRPPYTRESELTKLVHGDAFDETLDHIITPIAGFEETISAVSDMFSSTIIVQIPDPGGRTKHIEEWIYYLTMAGSLSLWGIYPLTIGETPPAVPVQQLLSFYKGRKPIYDYRPSNMRMANYTPYVAGVLAGLGRIYAKSQRSTERGIPAVLEVLDYPPSLSRVLLQYVSSSLYSRFEDVFLTVRGVRGVMRWPRN